jgi:C1A family cysteine protease
MRFAFILAVVAAFSTVDAKAFTDSQYEYLFTKWVSQNNKAYSHDQFFNKFNTFKTNLDKIHSHNKGNHSYSLAMNHLGDLSTAEFKQLLGYKGIDNSVLRSANAPHGLKHIKAADAVDWRQKSAVTPVKNQGQCGSCWAFSATGSLEGAAAVASGQLISLSEQQLMDCSTAQGNQGCNGGLMDNAFQWVIKNGGITGDKDDSYKGKQGSCSSSLPKRVSIKGFKDIPVGDENSLLQAVNLGPVSIAIEADQFVFQFYSGGVLDDKSCGTQLDHGVLIVGYGNDAASGKDYWTVKNSWGASWGEAGYIRLARNKNTCGLALAASYPTGAQVL